MLSIGSRWEKMRRCSSVGMLSRRELDGCELIWGKVIGRAGMQLKPGDSSYGVSVPESDLWSSVELVPVEEYWDSLSDPS